MLCSGDVLFKGALFLGRNIQGRFVLETDYSRALCSKDGIFKAIGSKDGIFKGALLQGRNIQEASFWRRIVSKRFVKGPFFQLYRVYLTVDI